MFEHPSFRRRDDGSIDIDFYRQAGLTERGVVMTGFLRGAKKALAGVVAVLLLAATFYMAPSREVAGRNAVSAVGARHDSTMLTPLSSSGRFAGTAGPAPM
jgi:hypothetical protein